MKWPALMMIVCAAVCCGGGAVWWWMRASTPAPEPPAPQMAQSDGSVILERRPDPAARPRQRIPKRARVERVAQIIIQPDAPAVTAGQPCPSVTVDMTLIREPDGGHRVLASSPDGRVVGGLDVPVTPAESPLPPKRWAAGLSWSPADRTSGIWVERDVRVPLINLDARLGLDLHQTGGVHASASGVDGRLRIGFVF